MREIDAAEREAYTLPTEAPDCLVVGGTRSSGCEVLVSNGAGRRPTRLPVPPSATFLAGRSFDLVLSVAQVLGDNWRIRLFVLDPDVSHGGVRALRTLGSLARHLGPVVHNAYLVGRLRSRAGAIERGRVGRELHDGVVQSLIGLKMRLEVVRRGAARDSKLGAELAQIEKLLRGEVLKLRMLMFQLTPADGRPNDLPVVLADLVERFERDSGISARFVSELGDVEASPRTCREIARILQEGLVNIQKHSGARNVLVRFSAQNGCWNLVVDDDGRGFDFAGRLSHDALDRARRGPRVIKERVRLLDGSLVVESTPGAGARLEITIPQRANPRLQF